MRYRRVLVKLSGGALAGGDAVGFDHGRLAHIADEVIAVTRLGIEVALVVGGGNIFRGNTAEAWGIERAEADNIGTMATVINSLMLRGVLKAKTDKDVRVMSALAVNAVAEPYIRLRAIHHLEKGHIVIFAGGNGQPYVTTDYPSVQRALEVNAEAILVAKHGVDGVYDSDPKRSLGARKYARLPYDEVIRADLKVMDSSAFLLARDYGLPLHVFNFDRLGAMKRICEGADEGTLVAAGAPVEYAD